MNDKEKTEDNIMPMDDSSDCHKSEILPLADSSDYHKSEILPLVDSPDCHKSEILQRSNVIPIPQRQTPKMIDGDRLVTVLSTLISPATQCTVHFTPPCRPEEPNNLTSANNSLANGSVLNDFNWCAASIASTSVHNIVQHRAPISGKSDEQHTSDEPDPEHLTRPNSQSNSSQHDDEKISDDDIFVFCNEQIANMENVQNEKLFVHPTVHEKIHVGIVEENIVPKQETDVSPSRDLQVDAVRNVSPNNSEESNDSSSEEIDNLILCQGIAACITDNYGSIGAYICTHCHQEIHGNDPDGNIIMASPDDVLYHVNSHYQDVGLGGIHMCAHCNREFYSEYALQNHIDTSHADVSDAVAYDDNDEDGDEDDDEDDDDDYNYNYNGNDEGYDWGRRNVVEYQFSCPICNMGFDDQLSLGNHFIATHEDYNDLIKLDHVKSDGFPGFDVLMKINMIKFIINNTTDNTCVICCDEYDHSMYSKSDIDINLLERHKKFKKFCDDTKLIYMKSIGKQHMYPIELKCCGAILCSKCLKNHISSKRGEPLCPFCKKNHSQYDKYYVVYDERPKLKRQLDPDPYGKKKLANINNNNNNRTYDFINNEMIDLIMANILSDWNNNTLNRNNDH